MFPMLIDIVNWYGGGFGRLGFAEDGKMCDQSDRNGIINGLPISLLPRPRASLPPYVSPKLLQKYRVPIILR